MGPTESKLLFSILIIQLPENMWANAQKALHARCKFLIEKTKYGRSLLYLRYIHLVYVLLFANEELKVFEHCAHTFYWID